MNTTGQSLKRFIPYYRPYKSIFIKDMIFAILTTVCEMVFPLIFRNLTNKGIAGDLSLGIVGKLALLYLLLRIVEIVARYYMQYTGHMMGANIEKDMRRDIFSHVQKLSDNFFNKTKVGHLLNRMTTDLFDITEFSHHCPEEFLIAGLKFILSFIILINVNVALTLIIYTIIPIMIYASTKYRRKMTENNRAQRHHIGDLNSSIEDTLLGVRVVKSYANEDVENEKFEEENERFVDIKDDMYKNTAGFLTVSRLFNALMNLTVILVGGAFVAQGKINPGDLVAYVLYVSTLLATVDRLVQFTEQFQKGVTGIERFFAIMDIEPEIKDAPGAIDLENVEGSIDFDHVSFKYEGNEEKTIKDFSLSIKRGEKIALVGPSGGGKSTICNLIPRFYDVDSGAIKVDGIDIRDIKLKSLRDNIGMVAQDVYLFSGTVYENIEYGKPGASKEEIIEAAKLAGAYNFIMGLDNGFDTFVGERGTKLSGGQKQRISIARMFLKNPSILILDEATSALDNKSEKIVQASLEDLAKGRTTITIAHRLSTIEDADRIIVITENGIEESGSHEELLEKKALYYKLYTGKNLLEME